SCATATCSISRRRRLRACPSTGVLLDDQRSQALEARLPANAGTRALNTRDKSFVPERDTGSALQRLEQIGHDRRRSGRARALPRVHELARRIDFEKFTLEHIGLSMDMAGCAPASAHAHVAGPFLGVEDAGPHPPVDDFL